jgi:hypothetical protein
MFVSPSMKGKLSHYNNDYFCAHCHYQCSVRTYLDLLGEYDWYQLVGDIAKAA